MRLRLGWLTFTVCLALAPTLHALDLDLDPPDKDPLAAEDIAGGGVSIQYVSARDPNKSLAGELYWRASNGVVAAQVTPLRALVDGHAVIAPRKVAEATGEKEIFPCEGRRGLGGGRHVLAPGDMPFEIDGGKIHAQHPALKCGPQEIRILCVPVRFEARTDDGEPAPVALKVSCGDEPLVREAERFKPLIAWLPVGLKYTSTFGAFEIGKDGALTADPAGLVKGVALTPEGLCLTLEPALNAKAKSSDTFKARVFEHTAGKHRIPCFTVPVVPPDEDAWLALDAQAFQEATKQVFDPQLLQYAGPTDRGAPPDWTRFPSAGSPPEALAQSAAQALRRTPERLAWLRIPLDHAKAIGASQLYITGPDFGMLRLEYVTADPAAVLTLAPHRGRSVFAQDERANFSVIVPSGFKGGEAKICAQRDGEAAKTLGTLALPVAETGFDSRSFTLRAADLPEGVYRLWVECGAQRSARVPLEIVSLVRNSSYFIHCMTACMGEYPVSDDGLRAAREAGYEMLCSGGSFSRLTAEMPEAPEHHWVTRETPALPLEAALRTGPNDTILQNMLRHRMRLIDYYPRAANLYNEGLTYHHSYAPAVERMVRRMQIFTQQTSDYPSFWGMNYSWFPAMDGYVEGGVDTDAWKGQCSRAREDALAQEGLKRLSKEERAQYAKLKDATDPAQRAQALEWMKREIAVWKRSFELGFGKYNSVYNAAVREVKPDARCVLYENAGHDPGKYTPALFADMCAVTYENYSDYAEWPFSAPFSVDWARGHFPGQPVWFTVDPGSTPEGQVKSLFYAFARGAAGSGAITPRNQRALLRLGLGQRAAAMYGTISGHAEPDGRVAILATASEQIVGGDGYYASHAMYAFLARLGFPARIVTDDTAKASGIPAGVRALVIVRQKHPLEPELEKALAAFQNQGGKVFVTGDSTVKIDGATVVPGKIRTLFELGGFTAHGPLWDAFENDWRKPLEDAFAQANILAAARTDPDRGLVATLDGGAVRYAVLMPVEKGQPTFVFKPSEGLPFSLEGTDWKVRDLLRQRDVPCTEANGRTEGRLDLITEPLTMLAWYRQAPGAVAISMRGTPELGTELSFSCDVTDGKTSLGAVPVAWKLFDASGRERLSVYRAAGETVAFPLPALDTPGTWKVVAQELLTGVTGTAELSVRAGKPSAAAVQTGPVQVVNADHLRAFLAGKGEKIILVDHAQATLLPLAKKLAEQLAAKGIPIRVWDAKPENFDTLPLRWFPRPTEDAPRWKLVQEGKLIGMRENLTPFVDARTRKHVPELGGYEEIAPVYAFGADSIVFSGGPLGDSLRAVTAWMDTPNVPGHGEGRLVVCFSAFGAWKKTLAVVANDAAGFEKAAAEIAAYTVAQAPTPAPAETPFAALATKAGTQAVPTPLVSFTPRQRVKRLLATPEGKAALYLEGNQDTLALIDEKGAVTATLASDLKDPAFASIDERGGVWELASRHLGGEWYQQALSLRGAGPDGKTSAEVPVYTGSVFFDTLPTDYQGGLRVAPNGRDALLGFRGGFVLGPWSGGGKRYDDVPGVPVRDAIRHPRFPVGAAFSPDARFVLVTMDTRPPGWGAMNWPSFHPTASELALFETATARRVWMHRDTDVRKSSFATLSGFGAVSNGGALTAITDYLGVMYLFDANGQVLASRQGTELQKDRFSRTPLNGVGVWMDPGGNLACFGFRQKVFFYAQKAFSSADVEEMVSGCVASDGSFAAVGLESGQVRAYAPDGKTAWTFESGGIAPLVAAGASRTVLVATSLGDLIALDAAGKEVRRTKVAEAADKERHAPVAAEPGACPVHYAEPGTLELAKTHLAAKQIAAWTPEGPGAEAFGRTFHSVNAPLTLTADASMQSFVHLVYRRVAGTKDLTLTVAGKETEKFVLDLATPEYRVVDVPVFSPHAKITLQANGPVDIAEYSLWSFAWPSPNLAYVKPAKAESIDLSTIPGGALDEPADPAQATMELEGAGGVAGEMKDCKIMVPNEDIDKIKGNYLKPGVDPLRMVDGRRFGNGQVPAWGIPFMGDWFLIDLKQALPVGLVATYERAQKQSELNQNIAVFSADEVEKVRAGAVANDQFWRIFPIDGGRIRTLGVHVFSSKANGLSEIEIYQNLKK